MSADLVFDLVLGAGLLADGDPADVVVPVQVADQHLEGALGIGIGRGDLRRGRGRLQPHRTVGSHR